MKIVKLSALMLLIASSALSLAKAADEEIVIENVVEQPAVQKGQGCPAAFAAHKDEDARLAAAEAAILPAEAEVDELVLDINTAPAADEEILLS